MTPTGSKQQILESMRSAPARPCNTASHTLRKEKTKLGESCLGNSRHSRLTLSFRLLLVYRVTSSSFSPFLSLQFVINIQRDMLLAALLLSSCLGVVSRSVGETDSTIKRYSIQMTGYSPAQVDDYVAVSVDAIPGYIVGFEPVANADRVHHMLLYGCSQPAMNSGFWRGMSTCGGGGSHILYAWARNAPNLVLPDNVGFSVGHESDSIRYFVLQVHYAHPFDGNVRDFSGVTLHISQQVPANLAAVLLFVSGEPIPPGKEQHQNNMSCTYSSDTELHPFAFRTHTHAMGRVVSAFFNHEGQWNKIGVRNPQWPQLFESIPSQPIIRKGDLMAATCRFDSHDKTEVTPMGAMGTNEMCNFYMMFYWDAKKENPFPNGALCFERDRPDITASYPVEGTSLLPSHPELEHHAHQSAKPFGVVQALSLHSIGDVTLGQVSGLSFDLEGNVIVFHRGSRVWDASTFDQYNILLDKTPIKEDTILFVKFSGNQSQIVKRYGSNKFYLPHGIHMDKEGFLYTTDVGSHTVAKWKINGNDLELVWESGEKLVPDSDKKHFCKPAGIVRSGDSIFVADGYCNSRVVELSLDGQRKNDFGLPGNGQGQFQLPHDVVSSQGKLFVTDRENGRVQELTSKGQFIESFSSRLFSNVYSADVSGDYVYLVPGRPTMAGLNDVQMNIEVFAGRIGSGLLEFSFGPTSLPFGAPHVLRVSPAGDSLYVGDIANGKGTLWKFDISHEDGTMKKPTERAGISAYLPTLSLNYSSSNSRTGGPPILLFVSIVVLLFLFAYLVMRKMRSESNVRGFDRKGFKPLRTEENASFISDGSDSE